MFGRFEHDGVAGSQGWGQLDRGEVQRLFHGMIPATTPMGSCTV